MKITLTKGNMKLPKETLNFSLPPQITCPNSTEECRKHCYAMKAWKQYPNVRTAWENNFELSKQDNFKELLIDSIKKFKRIKQVRINVSGDFYNQKQLDTWFSVAKEFKDLIFYAYTKMFNLDYSNKSNNFIILASDDKFEFSNVELQAKNFDGRAVIESDITKITCAKQCPADCKICNYCYTKSDEFKNLYFIKH